MSIKTVAMVFKFHPEVAERLRQLIKDNPPLTLSGFAQDAIVRSMRSWRPATEFMDEGRERKGRTVLPGALNPALDNPWGTPKASTTWGKQGWQDFWQHPSTTTEAVIDEINTLRAECGREALLESEYRAIVRYMGAQPGKPAQPVEVEDD